jgi:hypothetical protein
MRYSKSWSRFSAVAVAHVFKTYSRSSGRCGPSRRRFLEPLFNWVAQNARRLLAYEAELKRLRVSLPHNPVDGIHEIAKPFLCRNGSAMRGREIGGPLAHFHFELVSDLLE